MKERRMTDEEQHLAEALAETFATAAEAQVTVRFEPGYKGGVVVRLEWEGLEDSLHFPWRDVSRLLSVNLNLDQQNIIWNYREDE
jgi:hypothetical protein